MKCHYCLPNAAEHPDDYFYRKGGKPAGKLIYPLCCLSCAFTRYAKQSESLDNIEFKTTAKRKSNNPNGRPAYLKEPKTLTLRLDESDFHLLGKIAKEKKTTVTAIARSIILHSLVGSLPPEMVPPKPTAKRIAKRIKKAKPKPIRKAKPIVYAGIEGDIEGPGYDVALQEAGQKIIDDLFAE